MCSTEGPMGMVGLWLKKAFSVEASFYLHTDWLVFTAEVLSLGEAGLKRLQRGLRIYYRRFDSVFVLNRDQQQWLTGSMMGLSPDRVFLTAHWADPVFSNLLKRSRCEFPFDKRKPVILYAGRISKEKGVLEIPGIAGMIRSVHPDAQMVIAGTGPAEEELKQLFPDATYLGWVEQQYLPALYLASDIMVLPSRFDTFSCAVLEALSCGLPVAAYNTKGPKDILQHDVNGFLVQTAEEMAARVIAFLLDPEKRIAMKQEAFRRAEDYCSDKILDRLMLDTGIFKNHPSR
jgi:glycosyltransferase involved in cell wall biosynthesis